MLSISVCQGFQPIPPPYTFFSDGKWILEAVVSTVMKLLTRDSFRVFCKTSASLEPSCHVQNQLPNLPVHRGWSSLKRSFTWQGFSPMFCMVTGLNVPMYKMSPCKKCPWGHNVPRQNVPFTDCPHDKLSPRQNVPKTKRPRTKCPQGQNVPKTKRPQDKMSTRQNVHKTKRPQDKMSPRQNVPKTKYPQDKMTPDKMSPLAYIAKQGRFVMGHFVRTKRPRLPI